MPESPESDDISDTLETVVDTLESVLEALESVVDAVESVIDALGSILDALESVCKLSRASTTLSIRNIEQLDPGKVKKLRVSLESLHFLIAWRAVPRPQD